MFKFELLNKNHIVIVSEISDNYLTLMAILLPLLCKKRSNYYAIVYKNGKIIEFQDKNSIYTSQRRIY